MDGSAAALEKLGKRVRSAVSAKCRKNCSTISTGAFAGPQIFGRLEIASSQERNAAPLPRANMSSAQEPIHEEEWLILQFCQIGMDIDSWAAKETRGKPAEPLSAADHQWLVERLTSLGRVGRKTVEMLGSRLADMYQDRRKKITLIRHIVAILLCEDVFEPFAFGLSPNKSAYFKKIEIDLCLHGSNPTLEHTDG